MLASQAPAQGYPSRSIELVAHSAPGEGNAEFTKYFYERQTWVRNFLQSIGAIKS